MDDDVRNELERQAAKISEVQSNYVEVAMDVREIKVEQRHMISKADERDVATRAFMEEVKSENKAFAKEIKESNKTLMDEITSNRISLAKISAIVGIVTAAITYSVSRWGIK